jgi:hypothetical protein
MGGKSDIDCPYCSNPLAYSLHPAKKVVYQRTVYPDIVYENGTWTIPPAFQEACEHLIHLDIYPQAHYLGIRCKKDESFPPTPC